MSRKTIIVKKIFIFRPYKVNLGDFFRIIFSQVIKVKFRLRNMAKKDNEIYGLTHVFIHLVIQVKWFQH